MAGRPGLDGLGCLNGLPYAPGRDSDRSTLTTLRCGRPLACEMGPVNSWGGVRNPMALPAPSLGRAVRRRHSSPRGPRGGKRSRADRLRSSKRGHKFVTFVDGH